ncbi:hypothetical protein BDV29DRAFT_157355 [Aspergillus leporis]|jgi:hypothetical protein|uniref:Uncharacterized protein n=1 Tax=Aspergillus leporis TaxID=41062 RepID=A0A5N5X2L5_9EURO|nr:hypothetical protein BDV29DRAFT_157355 [Aspergillus leporis]
MLQPFPGFYIIRPQGSLVPLIPVDELPTWIQVGNWDWNDITLFTGMAPACFSSVPRIGEYDVVCHHCNSTLDSLHRSVSEQSAKSSNSSSLPVTKTNKIYSGAFISRSSQELLSPLTSSFLTPSKQLLFYTAEYPAFLRQPPYYANLQTPFVGMCLIPEYCQRLWRGAPPGDEGNPAEEENLAGEGTHLIPEYCRRLRKGTPSRDGENPAEEQDDNQNPPDDTQNHPDHNDEQDPDSPEVLRARYEISPKALKRPEFEETLPGRSTHSVPRSSVPLKDRPKSQRPPQRQPLATFADQGVPHPKPDSERGVEGWLKWMLKSQDTNVEAAGSSGHRRTTSPQNKKSAPGQGFPRRDSSKTVRFDEVNQGPQTDNTA